MACVTFECSGKVPWEEMSELYFKGDEMCQPTLRCNLHSLFFKQSSEFCETVRNTCTEMTWYCTRIIFSDLSLQTVQYTITPVGVFRWQKSCKLARIMRVGNSEMVSPNFVCQKKPIDTNNLHIEWERHQYFPFCQVEDLFVQHLE